MANVNEVTIVPISASDEGMGYMADPKSDTREVFIPSPPTRKTVKINPRPAIFLISGEKLSPDSARADAFKTKAADENIVIFSPAADDAKTLKEVFDDICKHAKAINIVKEQISVCYEGENKKTAEELIDLLAEDDISVEAPEEFAL